MNVGEPFPSREAFRAWLAAQPADREFRRADVYGCPLAQFIDGRVYNPGYRPNRHPMAPLRPVPQWARLFAGRVDTGVDTGGFLRITAAEALAILDGVPA